MTTQINTQEIIKKDFINIFEISHLFGVSGITARRYINGIFNEIELLKSKLRLSTQDDEALITQKLNTLLSKARRRVIGRTKAGEDIFILEIAQKEAFAKWGLRPIAKSAVQETQNLSTQNPTQTPDQQTSQKMPGQDNPQEVIADAYGQKYINLLETQLTEKDNTIKDLRETNKFLSITNGKLNEQLKLLLEKPPESEKRGE